MADIGPSLPRGVGGPVGGSFSLQPVTKNKKGKKGGIRYALDQLILGSLWVFPTRIHDELGTFSDCCNAFAWWKCAWDLYIPSKTEELKRLDEMPA